METVEIWSRRYLGAKTRLLHWTEKVIRDRAGTIRTFWDPFGGTGVVGNRFNEFDTKIITGDILLSNIICQKAFMLTNIAPNLIEPHLANVQTIANNSKELKGYWSQFGGKYWSEENANQIGAVRDAICTMFNKGVIDFQTDTVLMASLIYAADRLAWTCGHYDAYRTGTPVGGEVILRMPVYDWLKNTHNVVLWADAMDQADHVSRMKDRVDVCYLDPPYNSRQYGDAYHLLENLARGGNPHLAGKALKPSANRAHTRSAWCGKGAVRALNELVGAIQARWIFLSYSSMAERGHSRSNARLTDSQIVQALRSRGTVEIVEHDHPAFTAGRSDLPDHTERIFCCEVTK